MTESTGFSGAGRHTVRKWTQRLCGLLACCLLVLASAGTALRAEHADKATALPPIRHVFLIVLENKNFHETFGAHSPAPYLAHTLRGQGVLLTQYYGTGHNSLDNYIAMMGGQANTDDTSNDCSIFADFKQTGTAPGGQVVGKGCVYPRSVQMLANQLMAAGLTWKGYMQDMGNDPARESATCGHPRVDHPDLTEEAEAPSAAVPNGDMYATRHDPFVYFHSVIDQPFCKTHVVNLHELPADLRSIATTPNFSFITPNLCSDGHDSPCANGQPGGLKSINAFLEAWVPRILTSPAYKKDGLLIITFDEGGSGTIVRHDKEVDVTIDGRFCCRQPQGPNLTFKYPTTTTSVLGGKKIVTTTKSYGGDLPGALLISPYIRPGTESSIPYNHYSLLKSLEDIFGLHPYLGYAGEPGLRPFGADVFNAAKGE